MEIVFKNISKKYKAQIASANWTPVGRNLIFIAMVLVGASDSTKSRATAADQAA